MAEPTGPGPAPAWPRRRLDAPVGVLAHRGGTGPHPENSLDAFAAALRQGADGVELDVRRSADGVAVIHHDAVLPDGRSIAETGASELPPHVPTLADALAVCAGAAVDVEIKNSPGEAGHDPDEVLAVQVADLVVAALAGADGPRAVMVSSFWPASLAAVRAARPEVPIGLLVHPALDSMSALDQAGELGCGTLLPFRSQPLQALVDEAHGRGLAVVVWTVNDEADLREARRCGADAVVTDQVARAVSVLRTS